MYYRIQLLFLIFFPSIGSLISSDFGNFSSFNKNDTLVITSHRGYGGLFPENSLLSIEKALEIGVDRIEIDVHQTKDSVVVVMHDKTIDRTTNGQGSIATLTFDEIRKYSITDKGGEESVPSLEEVLELVNGKTQLLIEVKGNYSCIERQITDLITTFNAMDWCIVQSFDDEVLGRFHQISPELQLHQLLFFPHFYNFAKHNFVDEFSVYHKFASKRLVYKVHNLNKKLNVWTVNDTVRAKQLIEKELDGVITDYPERIIQMNEMR